MGSADTAQKSKLTREEKNWILYDVGNSAFILLVTTLIPIFFDLLGQKDGMTATKYLAYWGYASSVATLISALAGPVLGAVSDRKNRKKPIFIATISLGTVGCLFFGFARQWLIFLLIFVIARVGYNLSLVIYDSMLNDVTTEDRFDEVSSQGYAWGYIGSCIPFILCLALYVLAGKLHISDLTAMTIGFGLTAVWWFSVSVPLMKTYQQKHYITAGEETAQNAFVQLGHSIRDAAHERRVGLFLLAFFFYIDGVYTIIDMATAYGKSLGLETVGLLLALLVTQFVAFPSAILIGRLSKKYSVEKLIMICICAYFMIAVYAVFLHRQYQFWILAICVGMFQGGIQALSRSYFSKIIPAEKSGEYFGLYDILGKGASFLGTTLMGFVADKTGHQNYGVAIMTLFFIVGFILFLLSTKKKTGLRSGKPSEPSEEVPQTPGQ